MKTAPQNRSAILQRIPAVLLCLLLPASTLSAAPSSGPANDAKLPDAPAAYSRVQLIGVTVTETELHMAARTLQAAPAGAKPAPALQIVILDGEGTLNNIKDRTAREPIIQVQDENHKPVAGAAVLFSIDSQGGHAGASFLHGAKVFSGQTDSSGHIVAHGFHPNAHTGQFHINVTATKGPLTTHAAIAQTNVVAATSAATTSSTVGAFVATHVAVVSAVAGSVVAAGVVTGVVVATRTNPTSITTGTGAVGAPQILKHIF
jgi:hypothetical protein